MNDTAILIATYGTAREDADAGCRAFASEIADAFPGLSIAFASTSVKVREKLAGLGRVSLSPAQALNRLRDSGVRRVAVQSLHVIPGQEYTGLVTACEDVQKGPTPFASLAIGGPLLGCETDVEAAVAALPGYIPKDRSPDEAVVLVGHGSEADGARLYKAFLAKASAADPLLRLGLLTGGPGPEQTAASLVASGIRRACLLPFMCAPGYHVREDIAGTGPQSWSNVLQSAGVETRVVPCGASEHTGFRAIWMRHLHGALAALTPS